MFDDPILGERDCQARLDAQLATHGRITGGWRSNTCGRIRSRARHARHGHDGAGAVTIRTKLPTQIGTFSSL